MGVHQVRMELAGGVSRRQFSSHLERQREDTVVSQASPSELLALKHYAGYPQHSSQAALVPMEVAYKALKGLGCLHPCTTASFKEVMGRQGHMHLQPPRAAPAAARAAAARAAPAAAVPEAAPPPAAAAAAAGEPDENAPNWVGALAAPPPPPAVCPCLLTPNSHHLLPSLASPPPCCRGSPSLWSCLPST